MNHKISGRKFNRKGSHRAAMLRSLLTALFEHGSITTTLYKAKDIRPLAEKMITRAKTKSLANIRLVKKVLYTDASVNRLFDEISPSFVRSKRPGGYTRILKTGFRKGDASPVAVIQVISSNN